MVKLLSMIDRGPAAPEAGPAAGGARDAAGRLSKPSLELR